jgi:GT2 family glycosyltransferase
LLTDPIIDDARMRDLAVVTVLYNSADLVEACLASVPHQAQVIVVDNASGDDGLARAAAARPNATLVRSERNVGFGAGCNLGWRATCRPYLAFVNPDVHLRPDTLSILLSRLVVNRHCMVGPVLLDSSGAPRACKRRSAPFRDMIGLLPSANRWAPERWNGRLAPSHILHAEGGSVAAVEGACFVIARRDLEAIGGFDEDLFLYFEEESLALRLASLGGTALYEPHAVAEHKGAASTSTMMRFAARQLCRSRIILYRKRDGDARAFLAALMLGLGAAIALPASIANLILGRHTHATPRDWCDLLVGVHEGLTAELHYGRYG